MMVMHFCVLDQKEADIFLGIVSLSELNCSPKHLSPHWQKNEDGLSFFRFKQATMKNIVSSIYMPTCLNQADICNAMQTLFDT